jgi:hypothetical protein
MSTYTSVQLPTAITYLKLPTYIVSASVASESCPTLRGVRLSPALFTPWSPRRRGTKNTHVTPPGGCDAPCSASGRIILPPPVDASDICDRTEGYELRAVVIVHLVLMEYWCSSGGCLDIYLRNGGGLTCVPVVV